MTLEERIAVGVKNAFARQAIVDHVRIVRTLRRANRSLGRSLGRVEWAGSLEAYIRRSAELLLEGWTVDDDGPLSPPKQVWVGSVGRSHGRLVQLAAVERELWEAERAAHTSARLSPSRRLPVYLNAIEPPSRISSAALAALSAAALAAKDPQPRGREFAADKYWRWNDANWAQARAAISLPFLSRITQCFVDGMFAAVSFKRGAATRTVLIGRPRLRVRRGRLHAPNSPAVVWPDGSERWYWDGILVPERIAAARDLLTAGLVARVDNQELRRVALERMGWERFLATANAQLRQQDDYGKLWATRVWIDGEQVQLVEVVNATAEQDGSRRRYLLRVPPTTRTAREAVAWTFGFERDADYAPMVET
jgi:Domain of unknown function (DUF6745)